MLGVLNRFWDYIKSVIIEKFWYIFGIAFFNYVPYGILRIFLGKYKSFSMIYKSLKFILTFFEFFITVIAVIVVISLIFKKFRKIENFIVKFLFYVSLILFLIEIFLLKTFNYLISPPVIQILLETNKNETIEFIQTYLSVKMILITVILCICVFYTINILHQKLSGALKNKSFRRKRSVLCNVFKIIFMILLVVKCVDIKSDLKIFSFDRVLKSIKAGTENIKEYKELSSNLDKNVISLVSNNSKIKNIILILGESTGREHMSLYNYSLDTNPLLKKIEESKNLYKFTDTISPHAHTIPSIKKIFTFYNLESTKKWYEYNNIIDIMKAAGYETYWFSNQESSGVYGNVSAALGSRCDITKFTSLKSSGSESENLYDEEVIKLSDKYLKDNVNKKFIVYHLLGTHAKYRNRYPAEFNKFKNESSNRAEYDNAILYNDYVVNEIIEKFKNEDTVIFYISDHGEEVEEFRNFSGHSEENGSRYMVEIPFLVYFSDKYKKENPDMVKKIEVSLNRPYMTDDLIYTILDIAQIKTSEYDETRSVVSEKFNSSRKRIFSEKDYDTYWKNRN